MYMVLANPTYIALLRVRSAEGLQLLGMGNHLLERRMVLLAQSTLLAHCWPRAHCRPRAHCWPIVGPLLAHCWHIVGALLAHCWHIVDTLLAHCWPRAHCWHIVGPEHIVGPLLAHCWHLVGPEHIVGTLLAQFIQGTSLLALDTCMKKGRTDAGSLGAVLHLLGPYRTECLVPMHCLTTGFPAWLLQA